MKCKEVLKHFLPETMPNWMKYHEKKNIRIVRKVYSIGDLRCINDCDLYSSENLKSPMEKFKRHLPSSSNLNLNNNNTILTNTLGKLLVRKLTHRSNTNMTKSTIDLSTHQSEEPISKKFISKDNVQLIEEIGEGKFNTVVCKAFYRRTSNESLTVAVKIFYPHNLAKEFSINRDIKHAHIIEYFGLIIQTDQSIMLVMEYANNKSLYDCLISSNNKSEYSVHILLEFLKQIISAMIYFEKRLIIHKNLSTRNYLVFSKSLIKLSDWDFSWKENSKSSTAWLSPEVYHFQRYSNASDIYSFGISMWECFTYGDNPWNEMTNHQIIKLIDAPNHQRLPRPTYATSELYQIMLDCWKSEPSQRPTFSQLQKQFDEIEFKQVRWKNNNSNTSSINLPDGFLSVDACLLGPLTILDRCLHIPVSSNIIQCIAVDGQIGFVENNNVEPLHIISINKQSTINSMFHRKTGIKKTKAKQISKDMISLPQPDIIHTFHLGMKEESVNNVTHIEPTEIEPTASLFDEVMQAFTEIYTEPEVDLDQTETENQSTSLSQLFSKLTTKKSPETSSRFTRELEERSRNDLSEQGKHAYNLLINRCTSNSSSNPDEHSSSSISSNPEKSDSHSHYSSISSLNSRSSSINKTDPHTPFLTGQPLPPPPDLSSLGSKLTTATLTRNIQLPDSLKSTKSRTKKRFHFFA